ncbi:MAG: CBS domain-containing protein [Candidatus Bathyarchaeia archaeon]
MLVTGSYIRELRLKAGLTQKALAALVGVSQAHIAKIEQGKVDPRLSTVNRILVALKPGQERKCRDVMTKGVIFAKSNEAILKTSEIMVRNAVSQLPVLDGVRVVGTITEQGIVRNLRSSLASAKVSKIMDPPMPEVREDTSIEAVRAMLEKSPGVLVKKGGEAVGIITRSDLLRTIC